MTPQVGLAYTAPVPVNTTPVDHTVPTGTVPNRGIQPSVAGQWAKFSSPALVMGEVATGEVALPTVVMGEASEWEHAFSNPDPALSA